MSLEILERLCRARTPEEELAAATGALDLLRQVHRTPIFVGVRQCMRLRVALELLDQAAGRDPKKRRARLPTEALRALILAESEAQRAEVLERLELAVDCVIVSPPERAAHEPVDFLAECVVVEQ